MSQANFTKAEYLKALEAELKGFQPTAVAEILSDAAEHFEQARASGKSEAEAAAGLGEPRQLAAGYLAQGLLRESPPKGSSISSGSLILFRAMKALFIVAPLNFIFALGPFVLLVVFLFVGWLLSMIFAVIPVAGLVTFVAEGGLASLGFWTGLSLFFLGLAGIAGGVLLVLIMLKVTEAGLRAVWSWVRWNIDFIMAK